MRAGNLDKGFRGKGFRPFRGIDRPKKKGILLPLVLDANASIPVGFTELQHLDLTGWDGADTSALQGLVERIRSLVARGPASGRYEAAIEPLNVGSEDYLIPGTEALDLHHLYRAMA